MAAANLTPTQRNEILETRLERIRARMRSAKQGSEQVVERFAGAGAAMGGGVAAGVIWSKFGDGRPGSARIGGTQIEIDVALGVAMVTAAALGWAGKHADQLGTFGGGMLAARSAAWIGTVLEEREQRARAA